MEPGIATSLKFLRDAGLLGILILILFGGWKRWWVFGWQHDRLIARYDQDIARYAADRDDWKRMALAQTAVPAAPYAGIERRRAPRERRRVTDRATDAAPPPKGEDA